MLAATTATAAHWTTTSAARTSHGARLRVAAVARSANRISRRVLAVPRDGAGDPFAERRPRLEPEQLFRPRRVELPPRLSIRLRRVPDDFAVEAGRLGDHVCELLDPNLLARPQVDRVDAVVPEGGQHDALGAVVDVEELPGRRPVAPEDD